MKEDVRRTLTDLNWCVTFVERVNSTTRTSSKNIRETFTVGIRCVYGFVTVTVLEASV